MDTVPELHAGIDALDAERAEAHARALTLSAQTVRLTDELDVATVERDRLALANTDLARDLEVAQKRIADLEGQPNEPIVVDTHLGATINARPGQTYSQAFTAWEASRDRISVLRTFNASLPVNFTASNSSAQMRGRHRIISVKGEATAAYWDRYIASIPQDHTPGGERCITALVIWHEPENDGGSMTPARYRAACHLLEQRVRSSGRPDLIAGCVLMTWLERDAENLNTSSSDWMPTENVGNFALYMDPYDNNGTRSLQSLTEATLALWRRAGGVFWGIGETGTHRSGSAMAQWITTGANWAHDEGCSFLCWFHSGVGQNAGPAGWWLDDPQGIAAWKALAPVMPAD